MPQVRLIHWKPDEAKKHVASLRAAGYQVSAEPFDGPDALRKLRSRPPAALIVDLTRAPSQGRDVAVAMREHKATRHVPLVFAEGDRRKVAAIKKLLPDATYTTWGRIRSALKQAIARQPKTPVVPGSLLAGYARTPLVKKLGIKENSVVALVDAPPGFENVLGRLPTGASLERRNRGPSDLIIWFTKTSKELERGIARMAKQVGDGGMWIAWPKKTSPLAADLTGNEVRRVGLATGLVDYKICAIDADWSGLKFARRKPR